MFSIAFNSLLSRVIEGLVRAQSTVFKAYDPINDPMRQGYEVIT
jgi:hypothetical protein